jgi:hypothetical protein
MITPIVIETVRNGNTVVKQNPNGPATPAVPGRAR